MGAIAGSVCAVLVSIKTWFNIDDSCDVVAVHLGGGVIGSLCVGLFATRTVNPAGADGLFWGGGYKLLSAQAITVGKPTLEDVFMHLTGHTLWQEPDEQAAA